MNILTGCAQVLVVLLMVWGLCGLGQTPQNVTVLAPQALVSFQTDRQAERLARPYQLEFAQALFAVQASKKAAVAQQIPQALVLAVMAQESRFNTQAESSTGAIGLMQVIPRWHPEKVTDTESLWDPQVNVRVGAQALREYLDRRKTLRDALQQYNGNRGDKTYRYSRKVEKHLERIEAIL